MACAYAHLTLTGDKPCTRRTKSSAACSTSHGAPPALAPRLARARLPAPSHRCRTPLAPSRQPRPLPLPPHSLAALEHALHLDSASKEVADLRELLSWLPAPTDVEAWEALRELVLVAKQLKLQNPEIAALLDAPELSPADRLALRLYVYYKTADERPLIEEGAALVAAPPEAVEALRRYEQFAGVQYDSETADVLTGKLSGLQHELLYANWSQDLDICSPAFYVSANKQQKELILSVRGTHTKADVYYDLLAVGVPFEGSHAHQGMATGANFIGQNFLPLLRFLQEDGYKITLTGHSLGAGVASLLAVYLNNRGVKAQCWVYETPACMDVKLAQACSGLVTSTVNGDDVVPRLSVESFAGLLQALIDMPLEAIIARRAMDVPEELLKQLAKLFEYRLDHLLLEEKNRLGAKLAAAASGSGNGKVSAAGGNGVLAAAAAGAGAPSPLATAVAEAPAPMVRSPAEPPGFDPNYSAHVAGQVVLIYPPAAQGGRDNGGLALMDCTDPVVTTMRVSSHMVTDHYLDNVHI